MAYGITQAEKGITRLKNNFNRRMFVKKKSVLLQPKRKK